MVRRTRVTGAALATVLLAALLAVPMPVSAGSGSAPPGRASTGFGSDAGYVSAGATESSTGSAVLGTKVWWYVPDTLRDGSSAPVVVLLHGFALLAPDIYQGHIDHLTSQGIIVIFPQYNLAAPGLLFDTNQNDMQGRAIDATNEALGRIGAAAGDLHLYGHSLGAKIAATWQGAGGPTPASVTLANPSTGNGGPFGGTGIDWQAKAPSTTVPVLILTGDADTTAPPSESLALFDALTGAPTRVVYRAASDSHGSPDLKADHMAPIQDDGVIPAFMMEFLGGQGTDDALDFRYYQAALDAAIDGRPSLGFDMGTWSDGTAVSAPTTLAADLPPVVVAPGPPESVDGQAGDGTTTITWSAPGSDGGGPITGYAIQRDGSEVASVGPSARSYEDTGLTNGTAYRYSVTAQNSAGPSGPSDEVVLTPTAPDPPEAAVSVTKTVQEASVAAGEAVHYAVAIENTGEVPITDLTVQDEVAPDCGRSAGQLPPLPVGESVEVTCTHVPDGVDQLGPLVNVAMVDGAELAEPVSSDQATTTVLIPGHGFVDVPQWVAESVDWLAWDPDGQGPDQPLATGFGDRFRPNGAVSRAQLIRVMYRLAGEPVVQGNHPFEDVPGWVDDAVTWAFETEVITGFGDRFRPNGAVSRAQLVRMLFRLAGASPAAGGHPFVDVPGWVDDAVGWAFQTGLVNGYGDRFRPNGSVTRAELARILYRFNLDRRVGGLPARLMPDSLSR